MQAQAASMRVTTGSAAEVSQPSQQPRCSIRVDPQSGPVHGEHAGVDVHLDGDLARVGLEGQWRWEPR